MIRKLALALLMASPLLAVEPPRERERWTSMQIGELTIFSNAGDSLTRDAAVNLTRMRDAVEMGRPIPSHVVALRSETPLPLRELFAINTSSKEYNEGAHLGMFYAESWALVHYLMLGSTERQGQLATFLGLVGSGRNVDD